MTGIARTLTGDRVAIVIQRCHESVVGGAESLAWQYAGYLKDRYDVDVITTCAANADTWRNVFPAGAEEREGVTIRRFECLPGHTAYWHKLHEVLVHHHRSFTKRRNLARGSVPELLEATTRMIPWGPALQEEWIRSQGPYSVSMLEYIRTHREAYRVWIFVTYLFAPTYFGSDLAGRERSILVPALHDEPPAYLPVFRNMAHSVRRVFWNTKAEAELARRIWGADLDGPVVSMGVSTNTAVGTAPKAQPRILYILYCGRIDPGKGCDRLFRYFRLFQKQHPGPLKLLLTGNLQMALPKPRPGIRYLGFVSDAEKRRLMAGARAVIAPSPNESLSLITLEALAEGTPVLAYGGNPVLREHIEASQGGLLFTNYESFRVGLGRILGSPGLRESLGAGGEKYVREYFDESVVRARLHAEIERFPAAGVDA